jgi:hypothetical protein
VTVGQRHPFVDQPIEIVRLHIGKPERSNRIIPLLIGDDENNMRPVIGHGIDKDVKRVDN